MREPLAIVTASIMQNIVQILNKDTYFVTKVFSGNFEKSSFGALGVERPYGWAITTHLSRASHV